MEKVAYELSRHLAEITRVKLVKWGGSNKWLPFVLPYLFLRSVWVLLTDKVSAVYIEDGLLAPLGLVLKVFRKPVAVTIHGRDIAYKNRFYQLVVPRCIDRLDRVICNSVAIKNECIKRGIRETKTAVIPNGMSDEFYSGQGKDIFRQKLSQITGLNLNGKNILLSAGRLIEKKGIHWFVEAVMPCLVSADCIYVIAGDGILYDKIKNSINSLKLENHVYMLGWADSDMLKVLYNAADIFIMPDIPVEGDMEGFGLVAIEAAACSLPVVAANLDGIREAVADGQNGFMVEPGDIQGFTNKVRELLGDDKLRQNFGAQARRYTLENYGWESRAQRYLEEFAGMANN